MSKYVFAATLGLLATAAWAQTNSNPMAPNPVGARPPSVVLPELKLQGTVPTMFVTLVRESGLSGGVAISNQDCSQGPQGSLSLPAGTSVDVALGRIIQSTAMSEGQFRDGVVNLLPASGPLPSLKVWVQRFEWDRTAPVGEVIDRLRQLPEVSAEAVKLGLREAPLEGGMSAICLGGDCREKPKPTPILETEEGATLLAVLNRIVQAHRGAVWSYSEYHHCDKGTLFSLDALTE